MADSSQRTEQPTPRRLEKARKEGQFPASREFVGSITFLTFVWLAHSQATNALSASRKFMKGMLEQAFVAELTPLTVVHWLGRAGWGYLGMLCAAGLGLSALFAGVHLLTTGFGFSGKKLAPDFSRLNPMARLGQMLSQNLSACAQALLLLPAFGWIVWRLAKSNWATYLQLPRMPLEQGLGRVGESLGDLLWKASMLFLVFGAVDLFRQRRRWMGQLRMSKQEIREEQKEVEGNPLIRMRIRRLQREASRRRMMQQVPKATAVIVNPTHYAVAIRYQLSASGAPKVVAKGKNWLALRIREVAVRNQVPVVENAPLARSLYGSVEVGQEIPAHLYQAVAEVLAYIYRLMRGNLPGQ